MSILCDTEQLVAGSLGDDFAVTIDACLVHNSALDILVHMCETELIRVRKRMHIANRSFISISDDARPSGAQAIDIVIGCADNSRWIWRIQGGSPKFVHVGPLGRIPISTSNPWQRIYILPTDIASHLYKHFNN